MEIQLSRVGATAMAFSGIASPMRGSVTLPTRTRSMSGVGVYHVPALWSLNTKVADLGCAVAIPTARDQHDPQFPTYNFTTRQGPPICSPPV